MKWLLFLGGTPIVFVLSLCMFKCLFTEYPTEVKILVYSMSFGAVLIYAYFVWK